MWFQPTRGRFFLVSEVIYQTIKGVAIRLSQSVQVFPQQSVELAGKIYSTGHYSNFKAEERTAAEVSAPEVHALNVLSNAPCMQG